MNLSTLLQDYAIYNHWANSRIVDWLQTQPAGLLEQEMPSSFPSLKLTLLHIWGAEDVWLRRLQGSSPVRFISADFKGNLEELFSGFLRRSAEFRDFLGAQTPGYFEQSTSYTHTSGTPFTQRNAEIILHCLQHSTFHRGQLITMARNLGITDVPHTDYILYVRERG